MSGENQAGQVTPAASEVADLEPEQVITAGTPPEGAEPSDADDTTQNHEPKTYTEEDLIREKAKAAAKAERKAARAHEQQLKELQARFAEQTPPADGEPPKKMTVTPADVEAYLSEKKKADAFESFREKVEAATERNPEYMDVVSDPRNPFSEDMVLFFAESEVGDELAYQLAKNRTKALEIARMPPLQAGRALAKLEAEIAAAPPPKKVSTTPEPITPLRKSNSAAKNHDTTDPRAAKDLSTAEWIRQEEARMRRKLGGQ